MKRRYEPYGDFLTRRAAACPKGLNEFLATGLIRAANTAKSSHCSSGTEHHTGDVAPYLRTGRFGNVLVRKELAVERADTVDPQFRFVSDCRLTALKSPEAYAMPTPRWARCRASESQATRSGHS